MSVVPKPDRLVQLALRCAFYNVCHTMLCEEFGFVKKTVIYRTSMKLLHLTLVYCVNEMKASVLLFRIVTFKPDTLE